MRPSSAASSLMPSSALTTSSSTSTMTTVAISIQLVGVGDLDERVGQDAERAIVDRAVFEVHPVIAPRAHHHFGEGGGRDLGADGVAIGAGVDRGVALGPLHARIAETAQELTGVGRLGHLCGSPREYLAAAEGIDELRHHAARQAVVSMWSG